MKHAILILFFMPVLASAQYITLFDSTFNHNGIDILSTGYGDDRSYASAISPDGKVFIAGTGILEDEITFIAISALNPDGSPYTAFGTEGLVTVYINSEGSSYPKIENIKDMALQPDGKVIVCGTSYTESMPNDFIILRVNADGSPDNTFGDDGIAIFGALTDFGYDMHDMAAALSLQSDGKILAAGYSEEDYFYATLVRLNTDGTFDISFADDGVLVVHVDNTQFTDISLQSDGKIVCGGYIQGITWPYHRDPFLAK